MMQIVTIELPDGTPTGTNASYDGERWHSNDEALAARLDRITAEYEGDPDIEAVARHAIATLGSGSIVYLDRERWRRWGDEDGDVYVGPVRPDDWDRDDTN